MRIDLEEVIRNKNASLHRRLPKFLLRIGEKIIHQKDINYILETYGHLQGVDFITSVLDEVKVERCATGTHHLDPEKRYIFAANHPLGGLDGFVLAESIHRSMGDVRLIVNDLLMNVAPLQTLFVPVNKHGRQSTDYAKKINDLYLSDQPIVYFPAGLCSRRIHGKIVDLPWKKSFVTKAIESGRDIVPTFVSGRNSNLFYSLANIRKKLGTKFNLEMVLLPHELFAYRGKIKIHYGEPIPHERLKTEHTAEEWTQIIREKVYQLGKTQKRKN